MKEEPKPKPVNPEVELVVTPKKDLKLLDTLEEATEMLKEFEVQETQRYVLECCPKEFGVTGYTDFLHPPPPDTHTRIHTIAVRRRGWARLKYILFGFQIML